MKFCSVTHSTGQIVTAALDRVIAEECQRESGEDASEFGY